MSSISSGTTTTTGYVVSSDTTGALVLKTGASNTTAVTVDASQNVGIGTSSPSNKLNVVSSTSTIAGFTSSSSSAFLGLANSGATTFIGNDSTSGNFIIQTPASSFSTKLTLDPTGNLGLGVTPSANFMLEAGSTASPAARSFKLMTLTGGFSGGNYPLFGYNFRSTATSGVYKYDASDTASAINYSGAMSFLIAPSGTAGNNITWTTAMTLDADGDLGVGITSPLYKIHSSGTVARKYTTPGTTGSPAEEAGFVYADDGSTPVAGIWFFNTFSSGNTTQMAFKTRNSAGTVVEAVRIDAGQNVLIGATSFADGSNVFRISGSTISSGSSVTTTRTRLEFNSSGLGTVGSISTNGSATTYSTSSDYRLKNTIAPMTGALAKVALLKPCTYKWNADGSDGEGFIAHELAEVCPQAVVGEKDAIETYVDEDGNEQTRSVYQGIDTSFLVATLTAAIQEQQLLIQQLQADVAILKGVQQ